MTRKTIFCLMALFLLPFVVQAANRYEIESYLIDSVIMEDGSMKVKELFVLNGNLEVFQKNIYYRNSRLHMEKVYDYTHSAFHNGSGLQNIELKALELDKNDEISYSLFDAAFADLTKIYYEEDKKNKEYVESSMQDGKTLKIFYEKQESRVAFLIEYLVTDVILKHKDVAELYWTFVDSENNHEIDSLKVRITLPNAPTKELHSTWIHGDLTGSTKKISDRTVESTIRKVPKETAINIRMTFDSFLVPKVQIPKTTNIIAYQNILNIEKKHATEEQQFNEQREKVIWIIRSICEFYVVLIVLWWIYVYFKYDREYRAIFQDKYYKEIISDYDITIACTFLADEVLPISFVASFLHLIFKKNIKISSWPHRNNNYEFILDNREDVSHTEDVLLDLLFEKVGNKNKFSLEDLKKYTSENATSKVFLRYYLNWVNCVQKDTLREQFYEKNGQPIIASIFMLLLSFFLLFANLYFEVSLVLPWIVFVLSVLFFFYSSFLRKKSRKGIEDFTKWKAYQFFLEECDEFGPSSFDKHFLYSIAFFKEEKFLEKIPRRSIFKNKKVILAIKKEFLDAIERIHKL